MSSSTSAPEQAEQQLILRVPDRISDAVRRFSRGDADTDVTLEPLDQDGNFMLVVSGEAFPAKLVELPTILESHKTGDHKAFYKSSDISRMLYVYERPDGAPVDPRLDSLAELLPMVADPTPGSKDLILDSGITPPTEHIVRRRFKRANRFISKYSRDEVAEAERVLLDLMVRDSYEHVVEELVDAEPFMGPWFANSGGDNVTIVYEDGFVTEMYQIQAGQRAAVPGQRGIAKAPPPIVVRPNADGTFGKAGGAAAGGLASQSFSGSGGAIPPVFHPAAAYAAAGGGGVSSLMHAQGFPASALVTPSAAPAGDFSFDVSPSGAEASLQGLNAADFAALYSGDSGLEGAGSSAAASATAARLDAIGAVAAGFGAYDDLSGLDALPMDVFGDMDMGLVGLGGDAVMVWGDASQQFQQQHQQFGIAEDASGAAWAGIDGPFASQQLQPPQQQQVPHPQPSTSYAQQQQQLPHPQPSTSYAQQQQLPQPQPSTSYAQQQQQQLPHPPASADETRTSTAAEPSAAAGATPATFVFVHPESARLFAEIDALQTRLASLTAAIATKKQQAEKATIRSLRERWERDVRELEGKLAAEAASLERVRAELSGGSLER